MDRVDIHEDYDPTGSYHLELEDGKLAAEELAAKHGQSEETGEQDSAGKTGLAEILQGVWTDSSMRGISAFILTFSTRSFTISAGARFVLFRS